MSALVGRVLINAQIAAPPFRGLLGTYSLEHTRNLRRSSSGVGLTAAVEGDDRVSSTDADRRENISHNGSSGFGGNPDSAETTDLRPCNLKSLAADLVRR